MSTAGANLYQVHDNGGRPFTVLVEGPSGAQRVSVYHTRADRTEGYPVYYDLEVYQDSPPRPEELAISWEKVPRVWIAGCPSMYAGEEESLGNSLLIKLPNSESTPGNNSYVHIGVSIFKFTTVDPITAFDSPIDNNDVTYPAALSNSETFFLGDQQRLPRSLIKALGPVEENMKHLPVEALEWIFIHEALYGSPEEQKLWRKSDSGFNPQAKPLEGYEELVARPEN
ncbi:MAG: hypothetical protein JNM27_00255 [Leptospirales bacterium]|nr:hypothetical protein [Leptospirales bacterium]